MTDESKSSGGGDQAHLSATQSAEPDAEALRQCQRDATAIKIARLVVGLHVLTLLVAGHCMRLCAYYSVYPISLKVVALGVGIPAHIASEINFVFWIDNYWYLLLVVAVPALVINYRTALSIGRTLGPLWTERYGIALACIIASRAAYTYIVLKFPLIS